MKYRVLIVDDEEHIRKGIKARLEFFHYDFEEVIDVGSAAEALEVIGTKETHIVFTDIRMPEMDGLELIKRAKAISPGTQFIVLSGYAEFKYAETAIKLGVSTYLLKPVANEELKRETDLVIDTLNANHARAELLNRKTREAKEFLLEKQVNNFLIETNPDWNILSKELIDSLDLVHSFSCVLVIHIDGNKYQEKEITYKEQEQIRLGMQKHFYALDEDMSRVIVNDSLNNNQLLAVLTDTDEDKLRHTARRIAGELIRRIWADKKTSVTIGISDVHRGLEPVARKEADKAFAQRVCHGAGKVYCFADLEELSDRSFPIRQLNDLHSFIEKGDLKNVEYTIRNIFPDTSGKGVRFAHVQMIWGYIVNDLFKTINSASFRGNGKGYFTEEMMDGSALKNCITMSEVRQMCCDLIGKVVISYKDGISSNTGNCIKYAVAYIDVNYSEDLNCISLAERFGISPNYFSALFKKETGVSPLEYIRDLRLKHAKEMLRNTGKGVSEIARTVGFEDTSYFFKVFKRWVGVTPLQFRNGEEASEAETEDEDDLEEVQ